MIVFVTGYRMLISEIYESRQGEGLLTGTDSIFIRTSGCNLRCTFCDTPFTSWNPEGDQMTVDAIVDATNEFSAEHVVLTGGEPMLQKQVGELCASLKANHSPDQLHITIETAGTIFTDLKCDLMSISPKLSNSTPTVERAGEWSKKHEATREQFDVINRMIERYDYQLKYVVADPTDLAEIEQHLQCLENVDRQRVLLMPEGIDQVSLEAKESWLSPLCKEHGFVFCPRLHILWYGNKRGT